MKIELKKEKLYINDEATDVNKLSRETLLKVVEYSLDNKEKKLEDIFITDNPSDPVSVLFSDLIQEARNLEEKDNFDITE